MRKARSSKEKAQEADVESPQTDEADSAEESKPKRGKGKATARAAEEPERPVKRRAARKEGEDEEAREKVDREDERDRDERDDEEPGAPRPVLTAIPRPVRDDDLQGVSEEGAPAVQLPPPPATPEAPRLEPVREGAPMQVIMLNDLKRMSVRFVESLCIPRSLSTSALSNCSRRYHVADKSPRTTTDAGSSCRAF